MKKFLLAVIAVLVCLSVVGCNKGWKSSVTDYSGEVSSNGGFAVEKGDYVYFINGIGDNTDDNSYGTPVKGSVVRVKKSELTTADASANAEIVVPEMVYSTKTDNSNGLFIFGDYIYYATPCAEKDSNGSIRNTELEYMKAKLDGSERKVVATIASNSDDYRFVEIDGEVYLAINCKNDDGENVLRVYSASSCELVKESEVVSSYAFATDLNDGYAYYTTTVHNEDLDENENFNALRKIALDGSADEEVLNGAGTYTDKDNGIGIAGVTFEIVKYTGSHLYISETTVQTSNIKNYKAVATSELTTGEGASAANYGKLITIDNGSGLSSTVFADTSIYIAPNRILYFDSSFGIMIYDYTKMSEPSLGRIKVFYDKDLVSYTFKFLKDDVAYFSDSTYYYSFNISEVVDLTTGEIKKATPKVKRLTFSAVNSGWYLPEIVDDVLLASVSDDGFYSYVYAFDVNVANDKTQEEIDDYVADFNKSDREHFLKRHDLMAGIMSDSDKEAYDAYLNETYPEE